MELIQAFYYIPPDVANVERTTKAIQPGYYAASEYVALEVLKVNLLFKLSGNTNKSEDLVW